MLSAGEGSLLAGVAVVACRPRSTKLIIQEKLSSAGALIWKPPAASSVANPCSMLRSIRRAWISWPGSSRYPRSMAAQEAITRRSAGMSGSSGPVGRAALPAAYRPGCSLTYIRIACAPATRASLPARPWVASRMASATSVMARMAMRWASWAWPVTWL